MMMRLLSVLFILVNAVISISHKVSYDKRGLIIDGEHKLLFAGTIHYARGTVSSWNHSMRLAREMNLNTIQTYFIWNMHEPLTKGEFVWSGSANITQFLELAIENDLYVCLRLGPYIGGETNFAGFPWWTRDIPGIEFRTYNDVFMNEMSRILQIAINVVTPYLICNGGPIVMLQVENEYGYIPNATFGDMYVHWAVDTARNLTNGIVGCSNIPWIMDEHNPKFNTYTAVNTINGFWDEHNVMSARWPSPIWIDQHLQTFQNDPLWWTEDQAWFEEWNGGIVIRTTDQIANGILRWYALGGTYHAFYMFYGGINFKRHTTGRVASNYANDAPLTAYGIKNDPKYNKLAQVFNILNKYSTSISNVETIPQPIIINNNTNLQLINYTDILFISNIGISFIPSVRINNIIGISYDLAANSTIVIDSKGDVLVNSTGPSLNKEIYPDCILPENTANKTIPFVNNNSNWLYWNEIVGNASGNLNKTISSLPIEMWLITEDQTEYIWYTPFPLLFSINTTYSLQFPNSSAPQYVYIYDTTNNILLAMGWIFNTLKFNNNNNSISDLYYNISILIASLGMDGGSTEQTNTKGIVGDIFLNNYNIINNQSIKWISDGMLYGESLQIYNNISFNKVIWNNDIKNGLFKPLTWWRTTFITPNDIDVNNKQFVSIAIDMIGATKGFIYVNGYNLGRYWLIKSNCNGEAHGKYSYISMQYDDIYCPQKLPVQRYYAIPIDYLNPPGQSNNVVFIEEIGMINVANITIVYCQDT